MKRKRARDDTFPHAASELTETLFLTETDTFQSTHGLGCHTDLAGSKLPSTDGYSHSPQLFLITRLSVVGSLFSAIGPTVCRRAASGTGLHAVRRD